MALALIEMPGRRNTKNVSTGSLQMAEMHYVVFKDTNDATVRAFLDQNLPKKYEELIADTYDIDERTDDPGVWDVHATFKLPEDAQHNDDFQPVKIQFSTGGGSKTLKYSLQTIASGLCPKGNPDTAPDQKHAVNVSEDGIEGTEVPCPNLEFGFTYKVLPGMYNIYAIYEATATVNASFFQGFPPGTLLFMGCDGNVDVVNGGELTYKFAAKPNLTSQKIGGSRSFAVDGWDYVWARFDKREDVAAKKVTNVPTAWYVERMLTRTDFNLLGIL